MAETSDFSVTAMVRQLPYFTQAAGSALAELAAQATRRSFGPNETIFLEGEPSAGLWIVENGRVKAYRLSPDGCAIWWSGWMI
jgi:CRP-like cAMP-binding protein